MDQGRKKKVVEDTLKSYFDNFELPSLELCQHIILENNVLSRRSATQLKAFVANSIEKKKRSKLTAQILLRKVRSLKGKTKMSLKL